MKKYWLACICLLIFEFIYFPLKAQDVLPHAKSDTTRNSIGIKYDNTFFDKGKGKPWHLESVEYSRKIKQTKLITRVNYAQRFGMAAGQIEADAYPVLSKKIYAYLNVGYSPSKTLFPTFRSGVSLYFSLPAKFEVEGGARYLYFDKPIYIYTASVGKYYKKFWFNTSIFLSPQNSNISASYFLKTRYYLSDKDYIMLLLGTGLSPDNTVDNTLFNTYLKSKKIEVGYRRTIQKQTIIFLSTSLSNQQIRNDTYLNQYNVSIGFQFEF